MASATTIKTVAATAVTFNPGVTPFQVGNRICAESTSGATLYGVNSPAQSDTTKYAAFKQTISGNKAFELPSTITTPQNTTGGALSLANQLRVVGLVAGAAKFRARGDAVAPAAGFIVGAGGGTAAADATLQVKGTTAANMLAGSVLLSLASTGANTKTIIAGDQFTVAGDTTTYTFTGGGTLTLNGTTEINVGITPPLQVTQTAGLAVTITAATGKTLLFAEAPAVGAQVEAWVMASTDVITVTGGALTAGQNYDIESYNAFVCSANTVDIFPLAKA